LYRLGVTFGNRSETGRIGVSVEVKALPGAEGSVRGALFVLVGAAWRRVTLVPAEGVT